MKQLTAVEVHAQKVTELGLNPAASNLTSSEAIAGALRRAAGFLCPCTIATLIRGVAEPLRGLAGNVPDVKGLVEETLDAMIAHGDILEQPDVEAESAPAAATLLYAAPASFIARKSGAVLLLGIASDQLSALPDDIETRIEYVGHVRRLNPLGREDLRSDLAQLGLVDISYERWLKSPRSETPRQHLSRVGNLLDAAAPSRDVPGLTLLDPERPVRYYRGRWVGVRSQTGRFMARRNQAYGAQLWCYVQLRGGNPERLIDFPLSNSRWRGYDEAWRLQLAIDSERGQPQKFRLRSATDGSQVIEFFSPVPTWARRRWDAVGEPIPNSHCLFAYKIPQTEIAEEVRFIREELWLEELNEA